MPFPIRAVQIDGGPEFAAEFELACQQRGLHLFVLPPRSPQLNVHLNNLAKTSSKDRVLQIRAYLRDIFAEAVDHFLIWKRSRAGRAFCYQMLPN